MKAIAFSAIFAIVCNSAYSQLATYPPFPSTNPTLQYLPANIPLNQYGNNPLGGIWKLVIDEEFNNSTLNPNIWEVTNVCPNKAQNVDVIGGVCHLKTTSNGCGNYFNTAGEIRTRVNVAPKFRKVFERGMFQARIKFSKAFWSHETFWIWNDNGEIDVAEHYGYHTNAAKNFDFVLHNYYKDIPSSEPAYNKDHKCLYDIKAPKDLTDDFHVYTAIWDKNFIYFYLDGETSPRVKAPKWDFFVPGLGLVPYMNDFTGAGYYYPRECFFSINEAGHLVLSSGLDKKEADWNDFRKMAHSQYSGLPTSMQIDWVRIYQRSECDEDEIITNPVAMPYYNLSTPTSAAELQPHLSTSLRSITLGTQTGAQWPNLVARWTAGHYKARSITIHSNFENYPVFYDPDPLHGTPNDPADMKYSAFIFEAKECNWSENQYISIPPSEIPPEQGEGPEPPFNCEDLDTTFIDSVVYSLILSGDSAGLNWVQINLDSLGCDYWPTFGNKSGRTSEKPEFDGVTLAAGYTVKVFPNPTTNAFAIMTDAPKYSYRVINSVGVTVIEGKSQNERFNSIRFGESLPAGHYILQIRGDAISHNERLVLLR